jgi:hypothetical protein
MRRTKLGVGLGAAIAVATIAAVPIVSSMSAGAESADTVHGERPAAARFRTHPLDQLANAEALRDYVELLTLQDYLAALAASQRSSGGGGGGCAPGDWECFKACTVDIESGGAYGASSRNGTYRGAYQFDQSTWDSNAEASGRTDLVGQDPAAASVGDQDQVAYDTYQRRGKSPWGGRC